MKYFFSFVMMCFAIIANGQSVGINNPSPDASAILDITSINKGILIPALHRRCALASLPLQRDY